MLIRLFQYVSAMAYTPFTGRVHDLPSSLGVVLFSRYTRFPDGRPSRPSDARVVR